MRAAAGLILVLVAGCGTLRGHGDELYSQGKYAEAAEVYDQALQKDPTDSELIGKRLKARNASLRVVLQEAWKARQAAQMEAAVAKIDELLARKEAWQMQFEPAVVQSATAELAAVGAYAQNLVTNRARAMGPMIGGTVAIHFQPLLAHPDLEKYRTATAQALLQAGRDACAKLAPTAKSPYWAWVVNRYCQRVASTPVNVPRLPYLVSGLEIVGGVRGATRAEQATTYDVLAEAFRASVWYASEGAPALHGEVSGSISSQFDAQQTTKTVQYTVQIPYTDYENYQVSYQEPYEDTESYSEQVPETTYTTETYSCGESTCTRSVPQTTYRTDYKTRTVTKYRTAWKTEQRAVTKYRTEYRTFDYDVVERSGRYKSQLRIVLGPQVDRVVAEISGDFNEDGVDHDVTFTPAGITPSRANLTTAEEFVSHEQHRLAAEMTKKLDAQYSAHFCTLTRYSVEDAAQCAYLDASAVPPTAQDAFTSALGPDAALLGEILVRRQGD
ncbi:MAG TPA: tetratricopeptide repeat protein [Kofleriaceae bacterium]